MPMKGKTVGIQLADLLGYSVYRAFRDEDMDYSYFQKLLHGLYQGRDQMSPPNDGKLCVPLIQVRYEWDVLNDH